MKLKNIAVGDFVQIKKSMYHSEFEAKQLCEVIDVDPTDKYGFDVLIQGKNCLDWVNHKDLKKPKLKLKQLDQSVFDGLDSKWKYAAVDEVGTLKAFTYEPKLSVTRTGFILLIGSTVDIGTGYDASNWQNSLIERDTTKELTGSELCKAMLERGDIAVLCIASDFEDAPYSVYDAILRVDVNGKFIAHNTFWQYAVPINNQGKPLTASEVGL